METMVESPLQFSPQAVQEIRRLMNEPGFDKAAFLRIGVKGGGCSGLSYILGFDKKEDTDQEFESGDLNYIMNPSHSIYLTGMQIHWEDGLNARGFQFQQSQCFQNLRMRDVFRGVSIGHFPADPIGFFTAMAGLYNAYPQIFGFVVSSDSP